MKKPLLFLLLLTTVLSTSAQLTLNANGEYELKVTEQFSGISAKTLYESSLVALSDIVNSNYVRSSADCLNERDFSIRAFNDLLLEVLDVSRYMQKEVMDKDAGLIVSKGNLLVEVPKTHAESGYSASYVLKIHCKDGRVQYILTVPGILIGRWPTGAGKFVSYTAPLKYLSEDTHKEMVKVKERLTLRIESLIKSFQKDIVNQTKVVIANDF